MIIVPAGASVSISWVGHRDPPWNVVEGLQEVDPDADLRWVPGPFDRPPVWEMGVWWEPNALHRGDAGLILERQKRMPEKKKSPGRILFAEHVFEGWRPVFRIAGREPDARDVTEFKRRDYLFRTAFERALDAHVYMIENDEEWKQQEFRQKVRDMANDSALYRLVTGGFSVVTQGLKDTQEGAA